MIKKGLLLTSIGTFVYYKKSMNYLENEFNFCKREVTILPKTDNTKITFTDKDNYTISELIINYKTGEVHVYPRSYNSFYFFSPFIIIEKRTSNLIKEAIKEIKESNKLKNPNDQNDLIFQKFQFDKKIWEKEGAKIYSKLEEDINFKKLLNKFTEKDLGDENIGKNSGIVLTLEDYEKEKEKTFFNQLFKNEENEFHFLKNVFITCD